ncbi:hypothetical protein E2320_006393 [Naja naja]|nr:hypothetical protein E2320_006393 [Naja naja]
MSGGDPLSLQSLSSFAGARAASATPGRQFSFLLLLQARLSRRNCSFILFFGGVQSCNELGQNSLRNSYSSSTSGPNRGSQEDGRVLCMPSFPVASQCNLPTATFLLSFAQPSKQAQALPLQRNASPAGLPSKKMGLLEALLVPLLDS